MPVAFTPQSLETNYVDVVRKTQERRAQERQEEQLCQVCHSNQIDQKRYVWDSPKVKEDILGFLDRHREDLHLVYDGGWALWGARDLLMMLGFDLNNAFHAKKRHAAFKATRLFCHDDDRDLLISFLGFLIEEHENAEATEAMEQMQANAFAQNPPFHQPGMGLSDEEKAERERRREEQKREMERRAVASGSRFYTDGEPRNDSWTAISPMRREDALDAPQDRLMWAMRDQDEVTRWLGALSYSEDEVFVAERIMRCLGMCKVGDTVDAIDDGDETEREPSTNLARDMGAYLAKYAIDKEQHVVTAVRDVISSPEELARIYCSACGLDFPGMGDLRRHFEELGSGMDASLTDALEASVQGRVLLREVQIHAEVAKSDHLLTRNMEGYLAGIGSAILQGGMGYEGFVRDAWKLGVWEAFSIRGKDWTRNGSAVNLAHLILSLMSYHDPGVARDIDRLELTARI